MKTLCHAFLAMLCGLSFNAQAGNYTVDGYPHREHGRLLKDAIEEVVNGLERDAGSDIDVLYYVADDNDYLEKLLNGNSVEFSARQSWNMTVEPACGIRGEEQVLVALDDGSGTPTDFTRQALIASGLDEPMKVYTGLDYAQALIVTTLAREGNYNIGFLMNGSDQHSDGRLLSVLRRAGQGMAFVDRRHANAPGFATALYFADSANPDVPSVLDLNAGSFPPRFAVLYVNSNASDKDRKHAEDACRTAGDRYLDAASVTSSLEQLRTLHLSVMEEKSK